MTVTIRQNNEDRKALIDLGNHDRRFKAGIREALYDIGRTVQNEVKRTMREDPKTGRIYHRPGGRKHQASAPGESPAVDTGALIESVDYKVYSWQRMEIGDQMDYGLWLERGTKDGRILPRPHLKPSVKKTNGQAVEYLQKRVHERVTKKR